jgi:hypothetical protein|tara:strand:- start:4259 stop:4498 length:240 start_codon:yes stop_codon:yes gene_type:complete
MREVISIHIGQAGVQTGARFLVLVFLACGRMRRFSFSLSVVDFFSSSSFLGDDDDDDDDKTDLSQHSLLMRFFRIMNNR